jgi:hypothetical protein
MIAMSLSLYILAFYDSSLTDNEDYFTEVIAVTEFHFDI